MNLSLAVRAATALSLVLLAGSAGAESQADVLVRGPEAVLTRADWDAELLRIPAEQRTAFATSPQRVQTTLNNLLVNRTLAERARVQAIDKDPVVARRMALESDRVLAVLVLERMEIQAGVEFDRATERNATRARELYLVNPSKYTVPEEIDSSHILFDTSKRGTEAALAAAKEARAKLLAGADFAELAVAVSDDTSVPRNKGHLGWNPRGRFDPTFEAAAFALANAGQVSEPVLTRFGYHVIRLEGRRAGRQLAFDEVRDQIIAEMRQKHVGEVRDSTITAIRTDQRVKVNQEAVDSLIVKVDFPPVPGAQSKGSSPAAAPPAK